MELIINDKGEVVVLYRKEIVQTVTISSGIITISGPGKVIVCAETGTTDQLDRVNGLEEGDKVTLVADAGDTITIAKGTYLKSPVNYTLSGYRTIVFNSNGNDELWEETRSPNT